MSAEFPMLSPSGAAFERKLPSPSQSASRSFQSFGTRNLFDPIHGLLEIDLPTFRIIDTPQFQRLRYLDQLGTCYFVYPGASHKRFEHSIGVMHLASRLLRTLQHKQPELHLTDREIFLTKMAGLCHDLGHGPFSHVFDNEFIPLARPDRAGWCHEEASQMMLQALVDENGLLDADNGRFIDLKDPKPMIRDAHGTVRLYDVNKTSFDYGSSGFMFEEGDVRFLKELIKPKDYKYKSSDKDFLYEIVANASTGVDVDKFDYILRDCHNTGVQSSFSPERFIQKCRVIGNNICFAAKDAFSVYEMFHTRYSLFKQVYTHRVGKAVEYMICDAMLAADPIMGISQAIDSPSDYLKLTDDVLRRIENGTDERLAEAQAIIRRIRTRKLYKMVSETILNEEAVKRISGVQPKDIVGFQKAGRFGVTLRPEDLIINKYKINYGMKHKNPVESIWFHNFKNGMQVTGIPASKFHLSRRQISGVLPGGFQDTYLRIFLRDPTPEKLAAAQDCTMRFLRSHRIHRLNSTLCYRGPVSSGQLSSQSQSRDLRSYWRKSGASVESKDGGSVPPVSLQQSQANLSILLNSKPAVAQSDGKASIKPTASTSASSKPASQKSKGAGKKTARLPPKGDIKSMCAQLRANGKDLMGSAGDDGSEGKKVTVSSLTQSGPVDWGSLLSQGNAADPASQGVPSSMPWPVTPPRALPDVTLSQMSEASSTLVDLADAAGPGGSPVRRSPRRKSGRRSSEQSPTRSPAKRRKRGTVPEFGSMSPCRTPDPPQR